MTSERKDSRENPPAATPPDKVHGEGNYEASRQYNEATKEFVESGRVDAAAHAAQPRDAAEARALKEAERAGRARAKEEDPALRPSAPSQPGASQAAPAKPSRSTASDASQTSQPSPAREGDQAPTG